MKLYRIEYDGPPDWVEAESMPQAIEKWRAWVTAHDDVDADAEPDGVTMVADSADHVDRPFVVIR